MRTISDFDLVHLVQSGSKEAFDELVRRYHRKMLRVAIITLRRPEDAEEVANDVFVRVWKYIPKFRCECKLSTWLYMICRRLSINRMLKCMNRERNVLHIDDQIFIDDNEPTSWKDVLRSKEPNPSECAVLEEEETNVIDGLDLLSDKQKEIIVMRQKGMSYKEISQERGVLIGTVKSQLSRARDVLRGKVKR